MKFPRADSLKYNTVPREVQCVFPHIGRTAGDERLRGYPCVCGRRRISAKFSLFPLDKRANRVFIKRKQGGRIAQSVEQGTENPRVPSSILGPATIFCAFFPGGVRRQTSKPLGKP